MIHEYKTAKEDLATIIAQEICGFIGAIPDQDDYDLAAIFIEMINDDREENPHYEER